MSIHLKSATAALVLGAATLYASSNKDVFNEGVLPILEKHCGACHMVANPAGGLNISSLDALLSGGKHGPAITPGSAWRKDTEDAGWRSAERGCDRVAGQVHR
jgi:hypothetical protein